MSEYGARTLWTLPVQMCLMCEGLVSRYSLRLRGASMLLWVWYDDRLLGFNEFHIAPESGEGSLCRSICARCAGVWCHAGVLGWRERTD